MKYLEAIGIDRVANHEHVLTWQLLKGLQDIPNIEIYGPVEEMKSKIGAVCFNVKGWSSHDLSLALDDQWRILTRAGHHCCQPLMRWLGIWETHGGNVRASFHYYNLAEEVETLLEALKTLAG